MPAVAPALLRVEPDHARKAPARLQRTLARDRNGQPALQAANPTTCAVNLGRVDLKAGVTAIFSPSMTGLQPTGTKHHGRPDHWQGRAGGCAPRGRCHSPWIKNSLRKFEINRTNPIKNFSIIRGFLFPSTREISTLCLCSKCHGCHRLRTHALKAQESNQKIQQIQQIQQIQTIAVMPWCFKDQRPGNSMWEGSIGKNLLHTATLPEIAADPGGQQHFHYQTYSIEMKKLLIKTSIAGLSFLAFSTVHAQSATSAAINFTGRLTNTTCSIILADRTQTIDFGSLPGSTDGFDTVSIGGVAKPEFTKDININLENCSAPNQNQQPGGVLVSVTGPDVVAGVGRLKTNHSSLHIQLLQGNDTVWNIANPSDRINLSAGGNTLKFKARYYLIAALGSSFATTPATANATFNLAYN